MSIGVKWIPPLNVLSEAAIHFKGNIDRNGICQYNLNGISDKINLVQYLENDGIPENRTYFNNESEEKHLPNCGPFSVNFYIYKLQGMDKDLSKFIKSHRIYIYRDNIRIYPYGDPDNDWLKLDIYRGKAKAGYYLSNDQIIGYINISTELNPELIDKTNREGLLEQGTAYDDLRYLCLSLLNYLKTEYNKITINLEKPYRIKRKKAHGDSNIQLHEISEEIKKLFIEIEKNMENVDEKVLIDNVKNLETEYYKEKDLMGKQIDVVEDLAGVGISVDITSHDLIKYITRARQFVNDIKITIKNGCFITDELMKKINSIDELLFYSEGMLTGIQPLFRSTRKGREDINIKEIVTMTINYYQRLIDDRKIIVDLKQIGESLIVSCNKGILLQLFINLLDNSLYWLKVKKIDDPKILIEINEENRTVIFSDNGPGIEDDNVPYIFDPFFTTKGLEGRGLGLYIADKLIERYGYYIEYIPDEENKLLNGANFKIDFNIGGG